MDRLWAPWRQEYLQSASQDEDHGGCFLCEAIREGVNPSSLALYLDDLSLIILNRYPYNTGHLMLAPRRHIGELGELERDELIALGELTQRAVRWLGIVYHPQGFNIGMNLGRVAGAGLPGHLHLHIVPRWNGDTNYMPLIAKTKVLSESLQDSWHRLHQVIERDGQTLR